MQNEIILFETADKEIKLTVSVKNNTVWLNRNQLAKLFGRDVKTIGKHINNALKEELEEKLGTELLYAAAAIPPGVSEGSVKSIGYVLEGAGFEVTNIVDEPTAAAAVLKITDGAVVDVGGGTTGISILKDGKVIYTDDEATGGSHMTMTVAGHYRIPYEEAEVLKTTPEKEKEIFPVIKATVEKMASITEKFLKGYEIPAVYVVGGSASFQEFTSVFEKKLNLPVYRPVHPLLVTPLEIGRASCRERV